MLQEAYYTFFLLHGAFAELRWSDGMAQKQEPG